MVIQKSIKELNTKSRYLKWYVESSRQIFFKQFILENM